MHVAILAGRTTYSNLGTWATEEGKPVYVSKCDLRNLADVEPPLLVGPHCLRPHSLALVLQRCGRVLLQLFPARRLRGIISAEECFAQKVTFIVHHLWELRRWSALLGQLNSCCSSSRSSSGSARGTSCRSTTSRAGGTSCKRRRGGGLSTSRFEHLTVRGSPGCRSACASSRGTSRGGRWLSA